MVKAPTSFCLLGTTRSYNHFALALKIPAGDGPAGMMIQVLVAGLTIMFSEKMVIITVN